MFSLAEQRGDMQRTISFVKYGLNFDVIGRLLQTGAAPESLERLYSIEYSPRKFKVVLQLKHQEHQTEAKKTSSLQQGCSHRDVLHLLNRNGSSEAAAPPA